MTVKRYVEPDENWGAGFLPQEPGAELREPHLNWVPEARPNSPFELVAADE